jgi:hypothetical protein
MDSFASTLGLDIRLQICIAKLDRKKCIEKITYMRLISFTLSIFCNMIILDSPLIFSYQPMEELK